MPRPSKLTPSQWGEVQRRFLSGETARSLGREFGVSETAIRKKFGATESVVAQSLQVRQVAQKFADANLALEELPPLHRAVAMNLAEKLRSISHSVASAAELGAKTGYRLHALANSEVGKIDDADPLASVETLRSVGVLTKLGNDSLAPALSLLNANKEKLKDDHGDVFAKPSNEMTDDELAHIATAGSR